MKPLPTDQQILNAIYERYYDAFARHTAATPTRSAKVYVPIDIPAIAADLNVDVDIVFGRLYYHLDNKYGYTEPDSTKVSFFTLVAGKDTNCVNFPLLASVLAELRDQSRKHSLATWIAVASLVISLVSITISLMADG